MNDKKEAFSDKMVRILNYGALNLAMALGYRNRIFDVLEDLGRPAAVSEIAGAAGLNERYLREWLGIMVTGGIVELSEGPQGENLFFLPSEHAAFLTRQARDSNMGVYAQEIPLLTSCAMEAVHENFSRGGGVPFSFYPDFQEFMSQLSNAKHRETLIEKFLPTVDEGRLIERLAKGIRVCDLGCGEGVALNLMAEAFPESVFVGIDNHAQAVRTGEKVAGKMGLTNAEYRLLDAAEIHLDRDCAGRFDHVFAFDSIHDQPHPLRALKGVRHMLARGGLFSMIDIDAHSDPGDNLDHPMGPFLYTVSLMHCMPVGLNDDGRGLGMMWGREKAVSLLREAGFQDIDLIKMDHDPFNLHYLCKAS